MHPINQRVNQAMNSSSTANSPLLSTDYTGSPYSRSLTSSATSSSSKSIDNIQQAASHGLDVSYQSFPFAYQDAYSSLFVSTLSAEDPDVRYFEQAEDASQSPASFESEDIYHSYRQQQRSLFSIDAKPAATVHSYDLTSDFPLLVSLSPEGSEAQTDLHSTTSDESSSFSWSLQESSSLYLSDYGSPAFAKDAALTYDQSLYQGLMPLFLVDSKLQKYMDTRVCSSSPSLSPRASKRPVASTDPSSTESILLPHPKRVKLDSTWSSGTTSIFSQEESQCQVMTPTMHRRSCSVTAHSSPTSDSQNGDTSSYSSSNLSSSPQELLLSTEIPTAGLARKLKEQEMAIMRINQLRSRESRHRAEDGLPSGVHGPIVAPIQDDDISWGGLTVELRYDVVAWLLDVSPFKQETHLVR
ncbi:hypothetical protein FRC02_003192 [Tulasnella sp. 418]|nr:hypothetical protein FRC02_003192 [Tulasnella sp. 418]